MKVKNTIRYEKFYHLFVWGVALLVAALPFFEGTQVYGPAGAW